AIKPYFSKDTAKFTIQTVIINCAIKEYML
ncbi:unnamed protein product, partial [marine sediment metagenome]